MKCETQRTRHSVWHGPYERLSKRLDDLAGRDGHCSNSDLIWRLREQMFPDAEALEGSGAVKMPEEHDP